jgi:hypothetical protein
VAVRALAVPLLLAAAPAVAQQTRTLEPGSAPSPARIDQLAWLAGTWEGEGLGGTATEVYSAPRAGQIAGHFVQAKDGRVAFYELMQIVPDKGSLTYRLRHFHPDLVGWEDKTGRAVAFPLVAIERNAAFFDGMTFRRIGADTLEVWVRIDGDPPREERFTYRRAR